MAEPLLTPVPEAVAVPAPAPDSAPTEVAQPLPPPSPAPQRPRPVVAAPPPVPIPAPHADPLSVTVVHHVSIPLDTDLPELKQETDVPSPVESAPLPATVGSYDSLTAILLLVLSISGVLTSLFLWRRRSDQWLHAQMASDELRTEIWALKAQSRERAEAEVRAQSRIEEMMEAVKRLESRELPLAFDPCSVLLRLDELESSADRLHAATAKTRKSSSAKSKKPSADKS